MTSSERPFKVHYTMRGTSFTAEYADEWGARAFVGKLHSFHIVILYTEGF